MFRPIPGEEAETSAAPSYLVEEPGYSHAVSTMCAGCGKRYEAGEFHPCLKRSMELERRMIEARRLIELIRGDDVHWFERAAAICGVDWRVVGGWWRGGGSIPTEAQFQLLVVAVEAMQQKEPEDLP